MSHSNLLKIMLKTTISLAIIWVIYSFASGPWLSLWFNKNSMLWWFSWWIFYLKLLISLVIIRRTHSPALRLSLGCWLCRLRRYLTVLRYNRLYCLILILLFIFCLKVIVGHLCSLTSIYRVEVLPLAHGILVRLRSLFILIWLLLTQVLPRVCRALLSKQKGQDVFSVKAHIFGEFTNNLLKFH